MSAIVRSNFHTFHLKCNCSVRAQGNTLEHQNSAWSMIKKSKTCVKNWTSSALHFFYPLKLVCYKKVCLRQIVLEKN